MKWVCTVCGYVHEGDQPPAKCPICKVPADKFVKQEEDEAAQEPKEEKKVTKWVCTVCGYVHEGDQPPAKCPICKVPADKFVKQED